MCSLDTSNNTFVSFDCTRQEVPKGKLRFVKFIVRVTLLLVKYQY